MTAVPVAADEPEKPEWLLQDVPLVVSALLSMSTMQAMALLEALPEDPPDRSVGVTRR
ncbi:MAG TPA: hypothetical protein VFN28_14920 [Amaricoccus sp.]|nr:hypothetical protein [Amaricoccus sp.]